MNLYRLYAVVLLLVVSGCQAAPDGRDVSGDNGRDSGVVEDAVTGDVPADVPFDGVNRDVLDATGPSDLIEPADLVDASDATVMKDAIDPAEVPVVAPLFDNPHDGRMYAAAGSAVITPNDENHPCVKYMGGTGNERINEGVHDDLEVRAAVFQYNDQYLVLVAADLVGWLGQDIKFVQEILAARGVSADRLIVSSIHTHTGPDTMGIWGKLPDVSGRCDHYMHFLAQTVADLVTGLAPQMVPVTMYAAETTLNETSSDYPNLQADTRAPVVYNDNLTAAFFKDDGDNVVTTLVNWQSHPECMIGYNTYSADFVHYLRRRVDSELGGTTVYFNGTDGGLLTPLDIPIPERDADGRPVMEGEAPDALPRMVRDNNDVKARSLGFIIADYVADMLVSAPQIDSGIAVDSARVELPVTNFMLMLAVNSGILPPLDNMIVDNPAVCGQLGCLPQEIIHARMGTLDFIAVPGEAFPETSVGRPEMQVDFNDGRGIVTYPAMEGYRQHLPEGHLLIEIGLANNEIGYIVPATDFHDSDHVDYYEEGDAISDVGETLIRAAISSLLDGSIQN